MKLLFENWRKFKKLHEQGAGAVPHNCALLKDTEVTEVFRGKRYATTAGEKFEIADFCELVAKVPPLQSSKIVKYIGSGTMGLVFLLDNGHIFKLFAGKYGGKGEDYDMLWFKAISKRKAAGEAKNFEVALYGFDKLPEELFPSKLYWVEMEQLLPLTAHYKDNAVNGPLDENVQALTKHVFLFFTSQLRNFWKGEPESPQAKKIQSFEELDGEQAKAFVVDSIPDISGPLADRKGEFVSFLIDFINLYGEKFTGDVHFDNIALSLDKKTFKIFDVSGRR